MGRPKLNGYCFSPILSDAFPILANAYTYLYISHV